MTKIARITPATNREFNDFMPSYRKLDGWFRSDFVVNSSPDHIGFNVVNGSKLTGFEGAELAAAITLYGSTLAYTINAAENEITFTGAGVIVGFEFDGVKYSCANGECSLGTNGRKFYFKNATFGGLAITNFAPIAEFGGVKVGTVWVINNALGEAQVREV